MVDGGRKQERDPSGGVGKRRERKEAAAMVTTAAADDLMCFCFACLRLELGVVLLGH